MEDSWRVLDKVHGLDEAALGLPDTHGFWCLQSVLTLLDFFDFALKRPAACLYQYLDVLG